MIDSTSAGKGSFGMDGRVSAMYEQAGQVLGLSLEILFPDAKASDAEELRVGDSLFGVIGMETENI